MASYACDPCELIAGQCPTFLIGFQNRVHGMNGPNKPTPVGALAAMESDLNNAGVERIPVDTRAGHVHQSIRIAYKPRLTRSSITRSMDCLAKDYMPKKEEVVCLDKAFQGGFKTDMLTLQKLCDDLVMMSQIPGSVGTTFKDVSDDILNVTNALRHDMSRYICETIVANLGINKTFANNLPQTVIMIDGTTGANILKGFNTIERSFAEDNQMRGPMISIGGGNMTDFVKNMGNGCCSSEGFMWRELFDQGRIVHYFDSSVAAVTGNPNAVFIVAPGIFQFLHHNDAILNGIEKIGTTLFFELPDPYLPMIRYRVGIKSIECTNGEMNPSFEITLYIKTGKYIMPGDLLDPTDDLAGVNGLFQYNIATS